MIESVYFNLDMTLFYLNKYYYVNEILEKLISKFEKADNSEIDFYLP